VVNYLIWTHDDDTGNVREELPFNIRAYFNKKEIIKKLENRKAQTIAAKISKVSPIWLIGDVSSEKLKNKVAW
jgi:hypothetical protein